MKDKLIKIDFDHPNVRNAESFLSSWSDSFTLTASSDNRFDFRGNNAAVVVTVIFFDDYQEMLTYDKNLRRKNLPGTGSTTNGGALYIIKSEDPEILSDLAGHFAGKE